MHNVRVFEAHYSKMQKELTDKFAVAGIMDTISLYAEPIPEDERNMKECDFRINAFNFDKEPNKEHGIPFKFVVKPVCPHFKRPSVFFMSTNIFVGRKIQ